MQILVDLPDDMEQEVSFTLTGRALEHQKKTAVTAAMTQATATIETQREALAEAELKNRQQSDMLKTAAEKMEAVQQDLRISDTAYHDLENGLMDILGVPAGGDLFAAVKKLVAVIPKPPIIVPPSPPVVPVTPSSANELAVTIVDNGNYGTELMTRLRGYVEKIDKSDVRRVILFQNKQQMLDDKFPQVLLDKGLQWDADTMWSVWQKTTPPERAAYLEMAEKLKVTAYHFDDAHNNTPDELADAVKFMRGYTKKPIYASMAADDTRLPIKEYKKNPTTGKDEPVRYTMLDYQNAGLKITRQFFRQTEPVSVVDTWLKSGRILDGVNLEAFKEGIVTTTPADFEAMFNKCLAAGVPFLSVYTVVESAKWLMWDAAPTLWAKVNAMAVKMREARIVKA